MMTDEKKIEVPKKESPEEAEEKKTQAARKKVQDEVEKAAALHLDLVNKEKEETQKKQAEKAQKPSEK
jgi:hypothetical protein